MECKWDVPCSIIAEPGSKYCFIHNKLQGTKPEKKAKMYAIPKVSEKKKIALKLEKPERDAMSVFYAEMILKMPYGCQECGARLKDSMIPNPRTPVAHILPKRNFKSIAKDPINIVFLCRNCHDRMDNFSPEGMKIFPLLIERIKLMLPKIHDKERQYVPDYFT